ncbi:MAG: SMC family ATPase [Gemmatimonadetes bacterium]|nr:SMC family ATPase [Gemmatimonadota bacterium]
MQLHRLKLVNFRQHAETEIVLGLGLIAVIGPNGSGKTTLLEALAWALYGNPAARGSRESLRRIGAPARAPVRVEVDFTFGAHEYRVVRSLYGAELFQDGGAGPVANSHHSVSSKIVRLLGMTHDEFFSTYFTGQKELAVMASMGPSDRGKFLSRLLGYEKLRQAQQHLRLRRSTLRAEVNGLERGLEDLEALKREQAQDQQQLKDVNALVVELETDLKRAQAALQEAAPVWGRMKELRETNLAADGERRIAEQMVQDAGQAFERFDRELAEAIEAKSRIDGMRQDIARGRELRQELDHLDREGQAAGKRRLLSGQLTEVRQQVQHLEERLRSSENIEEAHAKAEQAVASARETLDELIKREEETHTAWVRDRQDAETKRATLLDHFTDLEKHREGIVEAGSDGKCPTCARPLKAEYESVLTSLDVQLEEIKANGKYYKARLEQLETEPEDLRAVHKEREKERQGLDSALQQLAGTGAEMRQRRESERDFGRLGKRVLQLEKDLDGLPDAYDAERHEVARAEMQKFEPLLETWMQLQAKAEHAERLVQEAERAERTLSEREERVRQLTGAMAASGYSDEVFEDARARHQTAERDVREIELRAAALRGDEKAALAAVESIGRRVEERGERAAKASTLRADLLLHDELDAALEGLRSELNAKLRPDLSDLGSTFVAELTDGRYQEFELDENYRIGVLEDGVPKPVISGGEEDVVNLALRLAISQMVAERAGQPLSLLVLDEIFGGLDETRRQGAVDLLRRLSDRFPQVILITHIESIKEGADQVLRVSVDPRTRAARVVEETGVENYGRPTA